ncbi:MAG TPA: SDR family oxidoreductase [Chthoniobacteraceae bacterium]|nr:SDR family oxidoreductase [Chthoniobacteraceae bacterium]
MKLSLEPGVVAISGGCGDIGLATARAFAEAGCRVALADLAEKPAGCNGFYHEKLDVSDPEAVEAWYENLERHFGEPPRYLVANAAIVTFRRCLEITPAEWKRELEVNLNGAFYFAQAGARRLAASNRPGRIVFVGSWAAHAPHRAIPAYSVAKAGMRMLCKTMALELAAHGIAVNEVAPGYVDAGLSGRAFEADPDLRAAAESGVPLARLLSPAQVAAQIVYLCSEAAAQITGTTVLVDGGLSLLQGPTSR